MITIGDIVLDSRTNMIGTVIKSRNDLPDGFHLVDWGDCQLINHERFLQDLQEEGI